MDITPKMATDLLKNHIYENIESAVKGEPYEKRICAMLEGPPGCGKTTIVRTAGKEVAEDTDFIEWAAGELGFEAEYFTRTELMAQNEAGDIGGLPWPQDGEMIKLRPEVLPDAGLCTLFFDEFRKGKTSVINAVSQVLLEGRIGPHPISPACSIIMASNERKDRAGDTELPSHTLDRITLYRLVVSRKESIEYAMKNGWHSGVVFFMESQPEHFNKHDENALIQSTPRSFERLSDRLMSGRYQGENLRAVCEGTIGPVPGHAIYTFLSLREKVPHPKKILEDPKGVAIPENRQSQWAMMSALSGFVEKKNMNALRDFLDRFNESVGGGKELSLPLVQSLMARDSTMFLTPAGTEICSQFTGTLFGDVS